MIVDLKAKHLRRAYFWLSVRRVPWLAVYLPFYALRRLVDALCGIALTQLYRLNNRRDDVRRQYAKLRREAEMKAKRISEREGHSNG